MKCDCCGIEQVEMGKAKWKIGDTEFTTPSYNVIIITSLNGKHICENCMHINTYVEALFNNINIGRMGVQYYADGSNPKNINSE